MLGLEYIELGVITAALLIGGVVKGITGIGLPIITIAVLIFFLPPQICIAIVVIPILVTNFWQAFRADNRMEPVRRFWPLILVLVVSMIVGTQLLAGLETQTFFMVLGVTVLLFSVSGLLRPRKAAISPQTEKFLGPLAALAGGLMGGLSTIYGPPLMMFFMTLHMNKDEWVRTIGVIWFAGALPLTVSYWSVGILNEQTLPLSALACLPGMAGILIGERIRKHINQDMFRKIMLVLLFGIGLNLLRKAFLS